MSARPRIALLDRDGTINVKAPEGQYVTAVDDFRFLPGALDAIARLTEAGIRSAVVTNQRCIARGLASQADVDAVHEHMLAEVGKAGGKVDNVYVCPHIGDGSCGCRKPLPGLLLRALGDAHLHPADAVMIGDAASDIAAGKAAGVETIQVGRRSDGADLTVRDLGAAVDALLAR